MPIEKSNEGGIHLQSEVKVSNVTVSYLTAKEASRIARIHPVTLLRWAREGKVPHRRLGSRKILFPSKPFSEWLESGYTDNAVRAAQP
jgi:excisionase family DNA binding protein